MMDGWLTRERISVAVTVRIRASHCCGGASSERV